MEDAIASYITSKGEDLIIYETGVHHEGPTQDYLTLCIDEKRKERRREGGVAVVVRSHLTILAPGYDYSIGQKLNRLPEGYKYLKDVFG